MEAHHWLPGEISGIPLVQMQSLWDPSGQPREVSAAEHLDLINGMRARRGLPPLPLKEK